MAATPPARAQESIGALVARLRLARGLSQLRLAELLCAAAGAPTITRHEVSRWEREVRVPGAHWLGWLAAVLEAPLVDLEAAAAAAHRRAPAGTGASPHRLPAAVSTADLLAALADTGGADLPGLAHAWLVSPPDPAGGPAVARAEPGTGQSLLAALRRTDDLMGGADLAPRVAAELRRVLGRCRDAPLDRRACRLAAGWAQLAGWVHADAGDPPRAVGAFRAGLHAATAGGDRLLSAHILGSVSHLWLATGAAPAALLLSRTAYAGVRHHAPARLRALLQHRVAMAAAAACERRAAHAALTAAERAAERSRPDREPPWLYWLDSAELAAMTGRCLVALGRPVRAAPLLVAGRPGAGPRTAALDAGWLARTYLELGEVEQACQVAAGAWRDAVRAGSVRVAAFLQQLHPLLLRHRDLPAVRGYEQLVTGLREYLPGPPGQGRHRERPRPVASGL